MLSQALGHRLVSFVKRPAWESLSRSKKSNVFLTDPSLVLLLESRPRDLVTCKYVHVAEERLY